MALHSYDRDMKTTSPKARPILIDRVQALVLAFFLMAWISLVAILVAAPEVYERRLRSLPGAQHIVDVVFVVALTAFIAFLSIGVLRRWRWAFWLILIAFLLGVLRVPVAVLQLSGQMTRAHLVRHPARRDRGGAGRDRAGDDPRLSALRGLGIVKSPRLINPSNAFR
jgi:hypothetical protein